MIIKTEQDLQEFVDMFHEAKINLYDDGETIWLTVNSYEYIRDFMCFFSDYELRKNNLTGFFTGNEELLFKWDEILPMLGIDENDLFLKIKNC